MKVIYINLSHYLSLFKNITLFITLSPNIILLKLINFYENLTERSKLHNYYNLETQLTQLKIKRSKLHNCDN